MGIRKCSTYDTRSNHDHCSPSLTFPLFLSSLKTSTIRPFSPLPALPMFIHVISCPPSSEGRVTMNTTFSTFLCVYLEMELRQCWPVLCLQVNQTLQFCYPMEWKSSATRSTSPSSTWNRAHLPCSILTCATERWWMLRLPGFPLLMSNLHSVLFVLSGWRQCRVEGDAAAAHGRLHIPARSAFWVILWSGD